MNRDVRKTNEMPARRSSTMKANKKTRLMERNMLLSDSILKALLQHLINTKGTTYTRLLIDRSSGMWEICMDI
jgi:hypothetical protein